MNQNSNLNTDNSNLKKEIYKYLFFWKFFILSIFIFITLGFIIYKYTSKSYKTTVKIKILDKKESALELPTFEDLFKHSKINLENEIEVLQSYPILDKVVRNLNLSTSVIVIGEIMENLVLDYPFKLTTNINQDSIVESLYRVDLDKDGLRITDYENNEKEYFFKNFTTKNVKHNLPFEVTDINSEKWFDRGYYISFNTIKNIISDLKSNILIEQIGKESDVISLSYQSTNKKYSENLLNELVRVFNNDGINDRRLIHKRTISFVNKRYANLSLELDSIEIQKQFFKVNNDLVDLVANSTITLEKNQKSEENLFNIENQLLIASSLLDILNNKTLELLPSNIGIENNEINSLIFSYNEMILERKKLILSAGTNNPSIKQVDQLLFDTRSNIVYSLQNHINQLGNLKNNLSIQSNKIENQVSDLPEKEKILRAIERNQIIKESLYLFLLQKREEAKVSFAVIEPSIKIVEQAISSKDPISPNLLIYMLLSLFLGFFVPYIIIYLNFVWDTKLHSREDIESVISTPVLAEIPFIKNNDEKVFNNPSQRSIIAESFRMLMSNVRYLLTSNKKSNTILVTSSIKGEGKTLIALNLSLAFASLNKKVLLIGCDLRNPQLHNHINIDKNNKGLVDYLVDNKSNWKKSIINHFEHLPTHNILITGSIPPNPLNLINNGNLEKLISEAEKEYDYIIIDTAPTLLVADTQSIIKLGDVLLCLVRSNVTEKSILNHIDKMNENDSINLGIVLNGVGEKNTYGYAYGYKYGYKYQYSYNYGYGYGYSEEKS